MCRCVRGYRGLLGERWRRVDGRLRWEACGRDRALAERKVEWQVIENGAGWDMRVQIETVRDLQDLELHMVKRMAEGGTAMKRSSPIDPS